MISKIKRSKKKPNQTKNFIIRILRNGKKYNYLKLLKNSFFLFSKFKYKNLSFLKNKRLHKLRLEKTIFNKESLKKNTFSYAFNIKTRYISKKRKKFVNVTKLLSTDVTTKNLFKLMSYMLNKIPLRTLQLRLFYLIFSFNFRSFTGLKVYRKLNTYYLACLKENKKFKKKKLSNKFTWFHGGYSYGSGLVNELHWESTYRFFIFQNIYFKNKLNYLKKGDIFFKSFSNLRFKPNLNIFSRNINYLSALIIRTEFGNKKKLKKMFIKKILHNKKFNKSFEKLLVRKILFNYFNNLKTKLNLSKYELSFKNVKFITEFNKFFKFKDKLKRNNKILNISYTRKNLWNKFYLYYLKKKNLKKRKLKKNKISLKKKKFNYFIVNKFINQYIYQKLYKQFNENIFNKNIYNNFFKKKKSINSIIRLVILKYLKIKNLRVKGRYFRSIYFNNFYIKKTSKFFKKINYLINFFSQNNKLLINKKIFNNKTNDRVFGEILNKNYSESITKDSISLYNIHIKFLKKLSKIVKKKKFLKYIQFKRKIMNLRQSVLYYNKVKYIKYRKTLFDIEFLLREYLLKPKEFSEDIFIGSETIKRFTIRKYKNWWDGYRYNHRRSKNKKKKTFVKIMKNVYKKTKPIRINTLMLKNYFKGMIFKSSKINKLNRKYNSKISKYNSKYIQFVNQTQIKDLKIFNKYIWIKQRSKKCFIQNFWYKKNILAFHV